MGSRSDEPGEFVAKYNKIVFPTEEDAERYYNERVTTRRARRGKEVLMAITTIQIDKETRSKLQQWDNSHFIGRRRTYDEILNSLLELHKQKE